ncbi:MAG: alpha-glucan family phosphorylase, partial [Pseudoclavibacter sp.]
GVSRLVPGVPSERIIALGAEDDPGRFNMAHLGLRLAQRSNGVAKLHGVVSRDMFADLYPGYDSDEVPITSITNGVHIPTWTRSAIKPTITAMSGNRDLSVAREWPQANAVGAAELWRVRRELRADLVDRARASVHRSWLQRGAQEAELGWVRDMLDPETLTIGFARRVSTYKRLTLMLQDPERFARILTNDERPVQIIVAGKAHPADNGGKQLMQALIQFADEAGVRKHIVFLPDYNVTIARILCAGSDVWLNNPVRPQEASGTSGMKAVMNGGLTFSISDGWWDEFADERFGWTIPTAVNVDDRTRDRLESSALYDLLEHEIAPMFYDRDDGGLPQAWLAKVRDSMSVLAPQVSAERMVRDYVTELYLPAGAAARRIAGADAPGDFARWRERVAAAWPDVQLTGVRTETAAPTAGESLRITANVRLGDLDPNDVRVEAVVGSAAPGTGELTERAAHAMSPDFSNEERYAVDVPVDRPGEIGFTVRVVPTHELLRSPAELGLVRLPS